MSNKQKYKPGVKITMNRFHKFWVGTTTVLLTAVMLTSCSGGTSSNTGGGRSSNTSSTGGTEITPVTPITSNTTPKPQPQNINLRRQNAQDTYTDCVRFGADNCDLDLRGVP
ncbi:MAG: hypothetical protein ACKPB9_06760 [Dolichospermum sp.]